MSLSSPVKQNEHSYYASLFLILNNAEPKNKIKKTKNSSLFSLFFIRSKLSNTLDNNHDTQIHYKWNRTWEVRRSKARSSESASCRNRSSAAPESPLNRATTGADEEDEEEDEEASSEIETRVNSWGLCFCPKEPSINAKPEAENVSSLQKKWKNIESKFQ